MIFHPAVISLSAGSGLVSFLVLYSSWFGSVILRSWDLRSGSELQLNLERKTYLVSTILSHVFGFQVMSFFLFIFTADNLHGLFTGAMCAAGTLNVNQYGYPAIAVKMLNFILSGLWLITNFTDNRAFDYPLIRTKYAMLLVLAPLLVVETLIQSMYFLGLNAEVITSCCGSLFGGTRNSGGFSLFSLSPMPLMIAFSVLMLATSLSGIYFYREGKGGTVFSLLSVMTFPLSVAALISFISPYVYELPTHHCPFCLLQGEYSYIGYLYYVFLLGGVVSGAGAGLLMFFRRIPSLVDAVPAIQKNLALTSVVLYLLFGALSAIQIVFSGLTTGG